jgi:hypothetical protein
MSSPSCCRPCVLSIALGLVLAAQPSPAVEPTGGPAKKVDWTGLDALLWAGDYEHAAKAAGDIVTAFKPKRRDSDFLAQSIGLFRALLRRGFAEFRLGQLDAAAATFDEARRIPRDSDFRRLMEIEVRGENPKAMNVIVPLEINLVELMDLQMLAILERLRLANLERVTGAARTTEEQAAFEATVGDWLDALDELEKSTGKAREFLRKRLDKAGPTFLASPHNRALVGRFWPALIAAVRSLELSRLPFGDPRSAASSQAPPAAEGDADRVWLAEARRSLREASTALDEAVVAAAPTGAAALKPDQNIEVLLMRAKVRLLEGEILLASGDSQGGRERFAQVAELVKQIAVLRKLKQPESHPDLFQPLLLGAEAALAEALRQSAAGDPTEGQKTMGEAAKLLSRAEALPFPPGHPLRSMLVHLRKQVDEELAEVVARIPGADAADVAARRLRRALDGAAVSSDIVSP